MAIQTLVGKGREAINLILDKDTFKENVIGEYKANPELGPGAVIGTGELLGKTVTVISNDAKVQNPRFPVVMAGVIGMEEAYKMAIAVYKSIEADRDKTKKRPLLLIVDTPGNGPGKIEEMFGMNKATGSYQLAILEARRQGHPVIAMIIGRAISGAFLCHGLHADRILALSNKFGTMIHVMPISSIARITKLDIEMLEELSRNNPVFASGADYFYRLGGLDEILENTEDISKIISRHIDEIYNLDLKSRYKTTGSSGRGNLGAQRGGRVIRNDVIEKIQQEFSLLEDNYL